MDGHRYAKAGCILNNFTPTGVSQLNLFDDTQPRSNSNQLMKVVDSINHSGLGKVWFAGRGIAPEWQMKREMLSPASLPAGTNYRSPDFEKKKIYGDFTMKEFKKILYIQYNKHKKSVVKIAINILRHSPVS